MRRLVSLLGAMAILCGCAFLPRSEPTTTVPPTLQQEATLTPSAMQTATLAPGATGTPTTTVTPLPTEQPTATLTPTSTLGLPMEPARNMLATLAAPAPLPLLRPSPLSGPEIGLVPTREPGLLAPTWTPAPLIYPDHVISATLPIQVTPTPSGAVAITEYTWSTSQGGLWVTIQGFAQNISTRPIRLVTVYIVLRDDQGRLLQTTTAYVGGGGVISSGGQAVWSTSASSPTAVAAVEIANVTWEWAD
jgi:hypothetical protein